uniref:Tudor domain containing 15 n=1 Tax=Oncorhynchus mykiss TaxID=8022 RepID=A0A8C7M0G4_ONCMY
MSDKLALSCESKSKDPSLQPAENMGLLCSVKGKDEKWHRGFVQFLPVNSKVRVLFVDYGFCESVKIENVLQLPLDFLSTPIMAFPCALSCLNGQDKAVKIQQLTCFKKGLLGGVLDVEINGFDKEQNLYSVTVLSAEDYAAVEAGPIQDVPGQRECDFVLESEPAFPLNGYLYYETAIIQAMDNSVIVEEMQEDSVFEGYVEHVLNPGAFWLRTQKRNIDFEEMMENMAKHFSQVQLDEEILENPEPGALCCAMYELDMHYYRAMVTDTLDNGAEVFFIDFGNTEKVPRMCIKQIPDKFTIEPAFALSCSLVNVMPFDDVWTISATDYFRRAVSSKTLLVHVVHIRKDLYVVDLYELENNSSQRASKSITEKPPKETWEISELFGCEKKPETQTFKPGSELVVRCSHVNTPSDFWCQLESKIPNLEDMMEAIQRYYQAHTLPVQLNDSCCVTKSKDDGRWYRACIIGAQRDEVEIIFVDYGIISKESVHNLQAIVPEFLDLEGQAFRCSLYNLIEPAKGSDSDWGREACDLLKYFAQGQSVKLTCYIHAQLYVKNKGLCNVVDLHNTQQNATKKLVEKGLAREVQTPMQLMPSVCPDSFVHSSFNLRCGSEEQVCVTHVCSPWEMYCQLDRNTEMIDNLMEKVATESKEILRANSGPEIGKLCLAKYYGDGKWYRGVACPVQSTTLLLNVFFVDYGNMHIVEKNNAVSIPRHSADLLFTPMQALRCSLSQIPKEDNFADVNKWLEKSILNKPLRAVVAGKNEDGTVFFDLFDGGININEKVKELIASQKPKEEKSSRPTQTVTPKEKNSNLDNSPQRFFLSPVNMDLGYSGFAAAVTTPSEFYIVLEDLLLIMNNVSTILEDLPKELLPLHEEHLIPGSCCLVRSDSKNKWCRAEIVHSDSTAVVINLVDYGHCVDMPYKDWSELRRLPDQLTRLPKVTYPCTLRGVKSVEGQWTDEAVIFFQECICKKNLQIYFRQYISEAHWEVDIVADGVHVAKDLVDAGHAEYIDIMLGLRFQEQRPIRAPEQKEGMSRVERTSKVEPEMTPPRTNKFLRRLNEELELDGHTSSEAAFHGQGFEKASEKTARATEYPDGQEAEMMTHCSTMTGTRHCKYFHLLIFFVLHVG